MSKVWAKSSNGPDWVDIESLMRAIGVLHSGNVNVRLLPDGIGSSGGMKVSAAIRFDVLPGSSVPPVVFVEDVFPSANCATIEGCVFGLLYRLDFAISQVYKNEKLWN